MSWRIGSAAASVPRNESHDVRRTACPYGPEKFLSGADPDVAALLGRPWLRGAATLRHGDGRGHVSSGDDATRAWAEAMEGRLRAALAPAEGRPLWRESEPAAALLPIPGDPQTLAAGSAGPVSQIALRDRGRSGGPRSPFRRGRLGEPDARRLGSRLGVLVRRHGSLAVHIFPAGRGLRGPTGIGRGHLRAGTDGGGMTGAW